MLACCCVLIVLLVWEYRSFRVHIAKLHALQDQYYGYINSVKRMLRKQNIGPRDMAINTLSEDECDSEAFVVVNRTPIYLKESSLSYVKDQKLDALMHRINTHEWDEYTEYAVNDTMRLQTVKTSSPSDKKTVSSKPQWYTKNQRTPLTSITFCSPIERSRFWLSSFFGSRKKPNGQIGFHQGIDMAAQRGTTVQAVASGTVEYAGYASGYGNTIVITHDAMYKTRYAHLDTIYVRRNQTVEQGKKIGAVGDTGYTIKKGRDASHLHFELYEQGKQVNPLALLAL